MRGSNPDHINFIAEENSLSISTVTSLAGGDINEVFLLTAEGQKLVVKLNNSRKFPGMFQAEKAGLEALAAPGIFTVPQIINTGEVNGASYLLLEYIETSTPTGNFWETFGKKLAALHKVSQKHFGFDSNNYIGSLPQQNNECKTASQFYITQRLEPQFRMAMDRGFDLGDISFIFKRSEELIPNEPPALIHGDLWGGNFLCTSNNHPCLIDPAVAYAPREMDLAMMQLFGGFNRELFSTYEGEFPLAAGFEERLSLWQLYYLLVHLNIFGAGYKSRVQGILNQYR